MIPTNFLFLFIIRVVFFLWSESIFILFLFFHLIRVGPSRSELIRRGLAVRVDPVRLLYLPLKICGKAHVWVWWCLCCDCGLVNNILCEAFTIYHVVYQATVTTQTSSDSCVGLATIFKECYRNHTAYFRRKSKMNETELSKHIWTLNDNNKPFTIKWRVLKQCKPYNSISNKRSLCLFEKYVIICKKNLCSLNKRNELASSCPHWTRYLLKNFVIK